MFIFETDRGEERKLLLTYIQSAGGPAVSAGGIDQNKSVYFPVLKGINTLMQLLNVNGYCLMGFSLESSA